MKLILATALFVSGFVSAQNYADYNQSRLNINKKLMVGLASWSTINAGVSSIGWATTEGESKYFHQMNTMWSGVNLALSIPGLIKASKPSGSIISTSKMTQLQNTDEKVFLFNTGLDLAYIVGGFYLKERSKNFPDSADKFRGWGNSIILQGSFLFMFDATAVFFHSRNRKKNLTPILDNLDLSFNNNGLGITFSL